MHPQNPATEGAPALPCYKPVPTCPLDSGGQSVPESVPLRYCYVSFSIAHSPTGIGSCSVIALLTVVQNENLSQSERRCGRDCGFRTPYTRPAGNGGMAQEVPAPRGATVLERARGVARVREGWHVSCPVVRAETCAEHPGCSGPRQDPRTVRTSAGAWGTATHAGRAAREVDVSEALSLSNDARNNRAKQAQLRHRPQ